MLRARLSLLRLTRLPVLLALGGCVDAYLPEVVEAPNRYLVVDGFINGNGVTRIKLSRSLNVNATTAPPPERGARLLIVDDAGRTYALTERGAGFYQSDSLQLPVGRRYRLRISAGGGATPTVYESALVPMKVTPPIDQVDWRMLEGKVSVQVSTHDASAQARYYRWSTAETWEFHVPFDSKIEYRNGYIFSSRTVPIYTCWRTELPSGIRQSTTAQLSQDAVTNYELLRLAPLSERFEVRYSVLVSQYAETAEEFAYNELLRKNTEAVGTVNDPLPVQLTGNVRRTSNASEPVLGYVGAHTVQQKRLFISSAEVGAHGYDEYDTPYRNCAPPDTLEVIYPYEKTGAVYPRSYIFANPDYTPTDLIISIIAPPGGYYGYLGASTLCTDCRLRGSNVKPAYW